MRFIFSRLNRWFFWFQKVLVPCQVIFSILLLSVMWGRLCFATDQVPIIDPPYLRQKRDQMMAAPSGDEPPPPPVPVETFLTSKPDAGLLESTDPSAIEQNVAQSMQSISLEEKIQQQMVQATLPQFGYDLFGMVPKTYAPVADIPVPPDYVVGPGDTIIVQVYGKLNVEYTLAVTREGRLLVPELGPELVSGLTFMELKQRLTSRFHERLIGATAVVTMGALRTIQVMVVGDVDRPGAYTVSGLSSLINALMVSGGIKRSGSLRDIQVKRSGRILTRFDLYDLLLKGDARNDIRLAHNDVIFVPPIGPTVGIGGEVQRPAIYEIKNERTVRDIIDMAGGLLPTASMTELHIERVHRRNYRTLVDFDLRNSTPISIQGGDIIRIFPVSSSMDSVVLLSGHVRRPGGYQWREGLRFSDILSSPMELLPQTDMGLAIIRREVRNERRNQIHYFSPSAALNHRGGAQDPRLKPRDELLIFDLAENRSASLRTMVSSLRDQATQKNPPMVFEVAGNVRYPGAFPLERDARLLDVLKVAGGMMPGTDTAYGLLTRKTWPGSRIEMLAFDLAAAASAPTSDYNLYIHPRDKIYIFNLADDRSRMIADDIATIRRQTRLGGRAPVVTISGWVHQPGEFPQTPGMRADDLIRAAGGLKEQAYGLSAELMRYALVDGEYRVSDHLVVDLKKILDGDRVNGAILHAHDHLSVYRKPNWGQDAKVKLSGEFVFPGDYTIRKGEPLSNVIRRAGGLSENAYAQGAVFLRESVKVKQQTALDRIQEDLDDLLVQLQLSPSVNNAEKLPADDQKHQIIKVIRQLKRTQALGRMVVDIEGIGAGRFESDILLSDGDHLHVPTRTNEVTVMGEVYYATSHLYRKMHKIQDYISLSGGPTVLGRKDHAYVVQANGEIHSVRPDHWLGSPKNIPVTPGATIYVPLNVDRINGLEKAQSWTKVLYQLAISAASLSVVGVF